MTQTTADARNHDDQARDREVARLDTLLAAWGVHAGRGLRPTRRKLAAALEKTGKSGLLTNATLRGLFEEGTRRRAATPELYVSGVLEDDAWSVVVEGLAQRENALRSRERPRFGDAPAKRDRSWRETQAESLGVTIEDYEATERRSRALDRVVFDHRTVEEIATEFGVSVETLRAWLDQAIGERLDLPADDLAGWERLQEERRRRGAANLRAGRPGGLRAGDDLRKVYAPRPAPRIDDSSERATHPAGGGFDVPF